MGEFFKRLFAKKPEKKLLKVMEPGQDRRMSNAPINGLLSAARDSNPEVRVHAILGIRNTRDPGAVPDLICILKDEDSAIRCAAAKALRGIGLSDEQFRSMAALLSEAITPAEKRSLIAVFQEIGDPRAIRILADDYRMKPDGLFPEAVWIIVATNSDNPMVTDSIPCLMKLLFDKNGVRESTKNSVAEMLGYIAGLCRSRGSIDLLCTRLDEAHEEVGKSPWLNQIAVSCIAKMKCIAEENKDRPLPSV